MNGSEETNYPCLNTSKTEIVLFKTGNKIITKHLNFCIRGQKIELSKSVKYLGIILQLYLYWILHLNQLCKKTKLRYYLFLRNLSVGKLSDRFLDSWEKELENAGENLYEVLIEEYVRKLFQLITQFKSITSRHNIIQEDWGC